MAWTRNRGMVSSGPNDGGASLGVNYATVATLTLTDPADGYLSLTAQASLNANDSTSFIDALIREGSTTVWSTHWEPGDDDGWYDQQQTLTTVVPVQKGKHTYALQLREQSAANLARSTGTLGWWRSSSRRGPSSEPTWQRADARGIANLRHQILVCGT